MIYAVVVAGGKGTRMGNTQLPKQYLMLGNKPVIIHTVEQFLLNDSVDQVVLCCPEAWIDYTQELIREYIKGGENIVIVQGGSTRNDSMINGCKYIIEANGVTEDDILITHDAVRPFINQRIIDDNIKAVYKYGAVTTAVEAFDTILESLEGESVHGVPNREHMYLTQTPQSFKFQKFVEVMESLTEEESGSLTDACKAFVIKGHKVHLVKGEVHNIKITTQYDLIVANNMREKGFL